MKEREKIKIPEDMVRIFLSDAIERLLFQRAFPRPFIISAERTGPAIFRKELNFARNRLLKEINETEKSNNYDPLRSLLKSSYQDYALPVEDNVDFTRNLESFTKRNSFLAEKHPDIFQEFEDMIGGSYLVNREGLYFKPKDKQLKLTMDESSSAVRSLLDLGFYLRHIAQPGDLLMMDEPELNLHPINQRRIARLFARLINLGIKVFLTTHSDYLIKELNTLLMLQRDKPYLKEIAKREGYVDAELIKPEQVKVYIAQKDKVKLEGRKNKSTCQTLVAADINADTGISVPSFDETIDEMNRIQEDIIWERSE